MGAGAGDLAVKRITSGILCMVVYIFFLDNQSPLVLQKFIFVCIHCCFFLESSLGNCGLPCFGT